MAKEVQQFGATTSQLASYKGKNKQIVVNRDNHRIHVMDGSTNGGVPHALKSEVDAAQAKANAALPKSGGTVTGGIALERDGRIHSKTNDTWVRVLGGSSIETGARIQIAGKDCQNYNGELWLVANNGTKTASLKITPEKGATWDGYNILTDSGCNIKGRLDITRNDADTAVIQKMNSATNESNPSAQQMRSWRVTDKDGKITGDFRVVQTTAGGINSQVIARKYKTDGSYIDSALTVGIDTSGNPFMSYGGFHVVRAESETTTVSKHSDGSLEVRMRAQIPIGSTSAALTFPEPFANSDFYVKITQRYFGDGLVNTCYGAQSTTGLTVNMEKTSSQVQNFDVIVKGRWK